MRIYLGDCLEKLKELPDNSIDSVVTDPPYGLKFMGKKWDYDIPGVVVWLEVYRVLKPGGHLLSFGGTRTYHRLASSIEDAGFEIRDQIQWLYGSGFPKSLDVSKAIDKAAGAEREKGFRPIAYPDSDCWGIPNSTPGKIKTHGQVFGQRESLENKSGMIETSYPATDSAKQWQGWGTALKPAFEPVVLACKPLTGADLLTTLACECQSKLFAEIVIRYSSSSLSEKIQRSIAPWLAGKSTLTPDVLSEVTAMLQSASAINSYLNTELSWLSTLDGIWTHANTCTTEMESSLITDLKILKSLLSNNTQKHTLQNDGPGEPLSASLVAKLLNGLELKLNFIHTSFAQGTVISEGALSSLHPDAEPIVLARKPLEKGLTVAQNVQKWGVGALNIDGCRIEAKDQAILDAAVKRMTGNAANAGAFQSSAQIKPNNAQGRWPANVLFDETAAAMLDEQSGQLSKQGSRKRKDCPSEMFSGGSKDSTFYGDSGGASRFFYVAKASKSERNRGLEGMPDRICGALDGNVDHNHVNRKIGAHPDIPTAKTQNNHPTVKPIRLMEYLIKLICPPNGTVLDPFMGSGSTGVAAKRLGFEFIGIEMNEEYIEIAKRRIEAA